MIGHTDPAPERTPDPAPSASPVQVQVPVAEPAGVDAAQPGDAQPEWGGRDGPEPTRYGDWEKNGRCIDF